MTSALDWARHSGDAWTRRWREIDAALSDLAPKLHSALLEAAPAGPFRAMDIGCGAGSTTKQHARDRPDVAIIACDLSPSLVQLAQDRLAGLGSVRVVLGDAETVAVAEGPFDLFFSRHGVMFFADPVPAFRSFRTAATRNATFVFSCFQDWQANPWASELASAAAGRPPPPPGREPSGFAFAELGYVREILQSAGWRDTKVLPAPFSYVAAKGSGAIDQALDFLSEIGPASRAMLSLREQERPAALERMRRVIERYCAGDIVEFPAAAWIWSAKAGAEAR